MAASLKRIPTPAELQRQARLETFGRTLREQLRKRSMSEADLARQLFGERPTAAGGTEALGRDRINLYVHGKQLPSQDVLNKLSEFLEFDFEKLIAPEVETLEELEFTVVTIPGDINRVLLRASVIAPFDEVARTIEFMRRVAEATRKR